MHQVIDKISVACPKVIHNYFSLSLSLSLSLLYEQKPLFSFPFSFEQKFHSTCFYERHLILPGSMTLYVEIIGGRLQNQLNLYLALYHGQKQNTINKILQYHLFTVKQKQRKFSKSIT